jgi:N-acyl-D-amino-acid deacylase
MTRWTMRPLALLLLLLGLLAPLPAGQKQTAKVPRTGPDDPDLASFDELMETFVRENEVPGVALAVAKDGRLVYARGFGYADPDSKLPVQPRSRFRIASISKPITAAAILRLMEMGKLKLDQPAFPLLDLTALAGEEEDPRLRKITVRHLLQHTAGFDRGKSFDPMFVARRIAAALQGASPPSAEQIIRYMMGGKLDFDPGSRYAYSNFGYCVLGRIIEKVTGKPYESVVRAAVLDPLRLGDTRLGKTLEQSRREVRYFDPKGRTGPAVVGPQLGKPVPLPYGIWDLEALDSAGGWVSSAPDLVRFASSLADPAQCPVLSPDSLRELFARPDGPPGHDDKGRPRSVYYGLGWNVRLAGRPGAISTWHTGSFAGTATLLVRRHDGLCWAVLFNARENARGQYLAGLIDPLLHRAAGRVQHWPTRDLFEPPS